LGERYFGQGQLAEKHADGDFRDEGEPEGEEPGG